jgi:hypothetical protein
VLTSNVTSISCKYTKLAHIIVTITSAKFIIQINRTFGGLIDNRVLGKERPIDAVSWQSAAADSQNRISLALCKH